MKRYSATYKIVTALLTLYYLLSLCGFNVHHDTVCGKSYLTLLYLGTGCSDIHPDSSCCGHSEAGTHQDGTHQETCGHSDACTHETCTHLEGKHPESCGQSGCCGDAGRGGDADGCNETEFSGDCNHCFNEAGMADDTADLRSGSRDREPLTALAAKMNDYVFRRNHPTLSSAAFKCQDDGRTHGIPLSMLCVSRT